MGYSSKVILRVNEKTKTGIPVVQVIINRQKRFYTVGFENKCSPEFWDQANERVRKGCPKSDSINLAITRWKTAIGRAFIALQRNGDFTVNDLDDYLAGGEATKERGDFYDWAEKELQMIAPSVRNTYMVRHRVVLKKLKTFRPKLTFKDLTPALVEQFRNYMITDLKNQQNTLSGNLKILKRLFIRAQQQDKIAKNPFDQIKIKFTPTNRVFLLENEVILLENLYFSNQFPDGVSNVTRNFLFCCYTGIRYGDLKALEWSQLQENFLSFQMSKTLGIVSIPLSDKAKRLLPERTGSRIFRVPSNQVTNRMLKEMAQQAGLEKNITTHVARHTFATLAITLGIPIEVVSKILGHANITMTMVYAKIIDKVKEREIMKFNAIGSSS
jgi:integrase